MMAVEPPPGSGSLRRHGQPRRYLPGGGEEEGFYDRLDLALTAHLGDGVVVGAEVAEISNVALNSIREGGGDAELAFFAGFLERQFFGGDADGFHFTAAARPFGAADDPFPENAVLPGILTEADAAAVLDLAGGLEEQQALIGVHEVDPPAENVAGQGEIILAWLVAEQGQAEPTLPLEGAVTRAGVAAHAAEQAHDVLLEIDLVEFGVARQLDGGAGSRDIQAQQRTERGEYPETDFVGSWHFS